MMKDVVVVVLDLRASRSLLEPGFRTVLLYGTGTEHGRCDPVELRRLVKLHERIRILPVTAGNIATVDKCDMHIGVVNQGVRESHAHRACTYD